MKTELTGDILTIRAIEDCIRATKKYTKGAFNRESKRPPMHIQGGEFSSSTLTEHYEVYPKVDLHWDMPVSKLLELSWGDHVDVKFWYKYNTDEAKVVVYGDQNTVKLLCDNIPGFKEAVDKAKTPTGAACVKVSSAAADNSAGRKALIKPDTAHASSEGLN